MEERLNKREEILLKEDRIKTILKLRKNKINQKLFQARQRKFNIDSLKEIKEEEKSSKEFNNSNINKKIKILKFDEEDYFIDPDDLDINEDLNSLEFVKTRDILTNITNLLNNINDLNCVLYGILMMRKFSVIDAVLINKANLFAENKLYLQICNILDYYYKNNKKLVFECFWILSSLAYESQDKNMFYFLLNDKCIDLYKRILEFYCENEYDNNIIKVMSTFILNLLVFKQKESENENNIINCDLNDDCLLNFLNDLVDLIISVDYIEEIYISLFIEITNCFDFEILLKNDLINKIITILVKESIKKLEEENCYYDEEIDRYYENYNLNSKIKINTIYQIILIQLQYFLVHPLKEMPFNSFKKLSEEILNKSKVIIDDNKHFGYYVEYINSYIYYLISLKLPLSYKEIKSLFDFLIYYIKNKSKNKAIIISCLESLNNLSERMELNKLIGFLVDEIPLLLNFIKDENSINLKIVKEIFDLLNTLLIEYNLKIQKDIKEEIFDCVLKCLKVFYDCDINNDIKQLLENGFNIISKIIESNKEREIQNNYKFLIESKGIKDIIYNLINLDNKVGIPIYLLDFLSINIY